MSRAGRRRRIVRGGCHRNLPTTSVHEASMQALALAFGGLFCDLRLLCCLCFANCLRLTSLLFFLSECLTPKKNSDAIPTATASSSASASSVSTALPLCSKPLEAFYHSNIEGLNVQPALQEAPDRPPPQPVIRLHEI